MIGFNIVTLFASGLVVATLMVWNKLKGVPKEDKEEEKSEEGGDEIPDERTRWRQVGTLSDIFIYPVKSGRFQRLDRAQCTSMGAASTHDLPLLIDGHFTSNIALRDRFFVVYNESGEFISGKVHSKMVLLQTKLESDDRIVFSIPGEGSVELKLPLEQKETTHVTVWKEKLPAVDCGDEVAAWISRAMLQKESGFRMGFWGECIKQRRDAKSSHGQLYKRIRNEDTGAYSDLSSFLLINKSSIDDMNRVIGDGAAFTPLHFRPNLVIEGLPPYKEDNIDWIKIGDNAVFRNFKPCTRCSFTTVDPFTGKRHPGQEPIKTLRKYRQLKDPELREAEHNSPVMGIYIGLYKMGLVKIGDPVYVSP